MSIHEDFPNPLASQRPPSGPSSPKGIPCETEGAPTKITDGGFTVTRQLSQPTSKPQISPTPSPIAPMAPSRAGTVSWQQRPSSRGSTGSSSRSMIAAESNAFKSSRAAVETTPATDDSMSRRQISQSLGSKDPNWFKQTQDRGLGSAAFRRNQNDSSDTATMIGSMRLPGMSRGSTTETKSHESSAPDSRPSKSPSREGSIRGGPEIAHKYSSSASLASAGGIGSPLPTMNSQRFDPPSTTSSSIGENLSIARTLAMSPSQGRLSPERMDRPASPTKGLGGFVQSAMLKRSDSVNKRWSAHAGSSLSRGNSIASNRSSYEGTRYPMGGLTPLKDSRPNSINREHSMETTPRPESSHSNTTLTQGQIEDERPNHPTSLTSIKSDSFQDEVSKSAPIHSKSFPAPKQDENEPSTSPPMSPSKKWSPTKASWLENAINKPESPKVMSPAPQQPAWMTEINRAKQQRGNTDLPKGGNFKEVATGGLIRSPPPGAGYKPPGINGLPSGFGAGVAMKHRTDSPENVDRRYESPKTSNDSGDPQESLSTHTPQKESETKGGSTRESQTNENLADLPSAKNHDSQLGQRTQSPKAAKSKPKTPPKIDFKSTLKSRQASEEPKSKDEPEFKNVFGNLKRTQTQNYKAPDELRDNILRGKAGLALTGNPKRTVRKDEFRESILKKKEGMVVPSVSTTITSASSRLQEHNVPEAIAKRQGLTRSERYLNNDSMERAGEPTKAEAQVKLQNLRDKPNPVLLEKPPSVGASAEKDSAFEGSPGGEFPTSLASILRRGPPTMATSGKPSLARSSDDGQESHTKVRPNDEEVASVGPQLEHATKARARGPKRRLPTASKQHGAECKLQSQREPESKPSLAESRPLASTHTAKSQTLSPSVPKPESRPLSNITFHNNNNHRKPSQPSSPRKPSTSVPQSSEIRASLPTSQIHGKELQKKPPPAVKVTPNLSPKDTKTPISLNSISGSLPLKQPATQEPLDVSFGSTSDRESRGLAPLELDGPTPSVKGAAAMWGEAPMQQSQPKSPVKLPTRKDEEVAKEEAGLGFRGSVRGPIGLGIETPIDGPKRSLDSNLPSPVTPSPRSPPLPGRKPASITNRVVSANIASPNIMAQASPATTHSTEPSESNLRGPSDLLASVFDEHPSSRTDINIDTQAVLSSRSSSDSLLKVKTLRKQIVEITDNGKSIPVPPHQEHILYEDCLYLCTHIFGTRAGTRTTEVYLWCGDGVPSSSVEDAQLFAKKAAKDNNGKLIVFRQGKETTNFFQALGGIVITRRGSGSRPESSFGTGATYLLCVRQHLGQIAFDEVKFSPRSLCKGFPYIISAGSGTLYLWKGSGAGADELGCARLIGMDLGLTGEIEEMDEGQEPETFWQIFPGGKSDASIAQRANAGHWHLKPSYETYMMRLYKVDVESSRPKSSSGFMQWGRRGSTLADTNAATTAQIKEIVPFAQIDLMDDGVFVLDAFFEIFM